MTKAFQRPQAVIYFGLSSMNIPSWFMLILQIGVTCKFYIAHSKSIPGYQV